MAPLTEVKRKYPNIFGLVTLIKRKEACCTEDYALFNSSVVIDADYVICRLMSDIPNEHFYFGGDYDIVRVYIEKFFKILSQCNIKPYLVFRGIDDKIDKSTKKLSDFSERLEIMKNAEIKDYSQFPYIFRENFVDIIHNCQFLPKVEVIRLDYFDNIEVANIAKELKCPVITHTNEYYLFDALYIPYITMDLKKAKTHNYIPCKIYKSDLFLKSIYNMNIKLLPVLAMVLGGTPFTRVDYRSLFRRLNIQSQDFSVKSLVLWLNDNFRRSGSITTVIEQVLRLINDIDEKEKIRSYIMKISMIYHNEGSEYMKMFSKDMEKLVSSEDIFKYKYRSCEFPKCFMNLLVHKQYLLKPLMEDFRLNHAHTVSLEIIGAIYKILTNSPEHLTISVRVGEEICQQKIDESVIHVLEDLPTISNIQQMSLEQRKQELLRILRFQNDDFVNAVEAVPEKWKLIVVALKYLMTKTDCKWSLVYAIILCKIVITEIDPKVDVIRTRKDLERYYHMKKLKQVLEDKDGVFSIPVKDCLSGLEVLIPYFEVEEELNEDSSLLDRCSMHRISEYQSCMVHINYLNSVFSLPFEKNMLCESFNGTFMYNMANGIAKASGHIREKEFGMTFINNLLTNAQGILKYFTFITDILKD